MSAAQPADKPAPVGVDPTRASIARVYDAALGGRDNYEIDRQVINEIARVTPAIRDLAWAGRNFLIRAARFVAKQTDLHQYLDCGSGLPTAENTHQVVQRIDQDARVVYVDNDPVVLAHGRALLEDNKTTFFSPADIFDVAEVMRDEVVTGKLDFTEPIALFHISTLHHYEGERGRPAEIMKEYIDALPSGSYVAVASFFDPENEHSELARSMEEIFRQSPMGSGTFRTKAEIEEFFPGLEMVSPGVVQCSKWWPDGPQLRELPSAASLVAGGVGRKP